MTPRTLLALVLAALAIVLAGPAEAHRLKLFVTVEGNTLSGYAFFVGGGRAESVAVTIAEPTEIVVYRGITDHDGAFSWSAPRPAAYRISVNTGDGHVVEQTIPAERFSPASPGAPAGPVPSPSSAPATSPDPARTDPAALDQRLEAAIDRALARQLRPLIEAQDQAESRLRLNDIMGGIGMIVGLAGLGMWASARRRPPPDRQDR
jgi:nickel transport protein